MGNFLDLQIKSSGTTEVPTTLKFGEPAFSQVGADRRVFIGKIDGTAEEIAGTNFQKKTAGLTSLNEAIGSTESSFTVIGRAGQNTAVNLRVVVSEVGNPTVNDDFTFGFIPGSIWVNQNTGIAFSAIDTGEGVAVWQQVTFPQVGSPIFFGGGLDCSANPNYPSSTIGELYLVTVSGKIGGASGVDVEGGDQILCIATNAGGTQASVGANFSIIQNNINNAVTSASVSSTNNSVAVMDGTSGKIIKDSGILINQSVTASTVVQRGVNSTIKSNYSLERQGYYINDGSTALITANDPRNIIIIGQSVPFTQSLAIVLPVATTLTNPTADTAYCAKIKNESDYPVEVYDGGENLLYIIPARQYYEVLNIDNSTTNGAWDNLGAVLTDFNTTTTGQADRLVKTTKDGLVETKSIIGNIELITKPAAGDFFVRTISNKTDVKFFGSDPSVNGLSLPNATTVPELYTVTIDNNYVGSSGNIEIYGGNYLLDPTVLETVGIGQIAVATVVDRSTVQGSWRISLTAGRVIDGGTF